MVRLPLILGLFVACWFVPRPITAIPSHPGLIAQSSRCPQDVETLAALMLRDLPSYANRVMQRSRRLSRPYTSKSYVVVAGPAELEPLTLGPGVYTPPAPTTDLQPPQQLFFTTLERYYSGGKASYRQLYHWLFLTQTTNGWYLALMYSRIGNAPESEQSPTPPYESSEGVVGQAVKTWLRDCRAGAIRRLESDSQD